MKNKYAQSILLLTGLIFGVLSLYLTFHWYDWKLATILFLALFGNNLGRSNS